MTDAKRQEIKEKVAAGEARQRSRGSSEGSFLDAAGERAIEVKDKVTGFAREHPITTVAGALAVGVLISGLFRGSPTRRWGRHAAGRAAGLATLGAEMAMTYAQRALEAAQEAGHVGGERLDDLGETLGERAHRYGKEARHYARKAGSRAQHYASEAREASGHYAREARDHAEHLSEDVRKSLRRRWRQR